MEEAMRDLKHAARSLWRAPTFTIVAIITLALGLGPNTAIFSVIYGVLFRPLPYADPDRLVQATWQFESGNTNGVTATEYDYWSRHSQAFAAAAAMSNRGRGVALQTQNGPKYVRGLVVSGNLFSVLGVPPRLGRSFDSDELRDGGPPAVVISGAMWRSDFHADPGIIGRTLDLDGVPTPIVGVMPPGFQVGDEQIDTWLPLRAVPNPRDQGHNTIMLARLNKGVSIGEAQSQMGSVLAGLRADVPGHVGPGERGVLLVPYHQVLVSDVRTPLFLLAATVLLVALIAIANTTALFVGRASSRRTELAVRVALGAAKWDLVRPQVTEAMLVAVGGGVAGILLAWATLQSVLAIAPLPLAHLVKIDLPAMIATFVLCCVAGVVAGVVPVFGLMRADLQAYLRADGSRTVLGRSLGRRVLVAIELALSLVLVIGAGLLIASLADLWRVSPGFSPKNVWVAQFTLPDQRYGSAEAVWRFESQLIDRLGQQLGTPDVATVSSIPLERGLNDWIRVPGGAQTRQTLVERRLVSPAYFSTLRIPLVRGRELTEQDLSTAPHVVVINTKLAKLDWPDSEPIGQTVLVDGTPAQIVGVVGDVHETGLDGDAPAMVYQPQAQATDGMTRAVARWFPTSVILRTPVAPSLKSIAAIVNSIDPAQPVRDVRSLESVMSASMGSRRFVQMLLTIFAGLALVLASVGVYGVVAYSVARRRREIGLRMALGASQSGVLGLILLEGLRVAAVGLLVGVIASFAATRLLRTLLFGVGPTNPVVFLAGVLALLITSVVASLIPSERAARVDPVEALRAE